MDGFLFYKGWYCALVGEYSLIRPTSIASHPEWCHSDDHLTYVISDQSCALEGKWWVMPNCALAGEKKCYGDLEDSCDEMGGIYYTDELLRVEDGIDGNSCAFPTPVWSLYFQVVGGEEGAQNAEMCDALGGVLYNGGWNCLLDGDGISISNTPADDTWMSTCEKNGGTLFDGNHSCALNGTWTDIVDQTGADQSRYDSFTAMCSAVDGILYNNEDETWAESNCVAPGVWSVAASCSEECLIDPCSPISADTCQGMGGYIFGNNSHGCLLPDEWTFIDVCYPGANDNDNCDSKGSCSWSQCNQAAGEQNRSSC
tara:strand:+ start:115 stop:1053 length:939 start_codon:yes stop_codon:yes gene_type:complete